MFHQINYEKYNPEKDLESNEFMSARVILHIYCVKHGTAAVKVDPDHNFSFREKEFLPSIMENLHESSCDTEMPIQRAECAKKVSAIIESYYHMLKEWDRTTLQSQKDDTNTYVKALALPHGAWQSYISILLHEKGCQSRAEEMHKIWEKKNATNECSDFAILTITMMHGAGQASGKFTYKIIDDKDQVLFEIDQKLAMLMLD